MKKILKATLKFTLLFVGGIMLFGGGICVTSNIIFALPNPFQQTNILLLLLMGISALCAWLGWKLIQFAKRNDEKNSPVE
jgi:membrane protein implicated in regulation of membrane protease activity